MTEVVAAGLKFATYLVALLIIGRRFGSRQLSARMAASLAILASCSGLVLMARLGGFEWPIAETVLQTRAGAALCLLIGGATLIIVGRAADWAQWMAAGLILAGLSWSGHAAARGPLVQGLLVLHLAAGAWWIGALLKLRRAARSQAAGDFRRAVSRFSGPALVVTAGLAATGAAAAWLVLEGRLPSPAYGGWFLAKIALAGAALLVAAWNRWVLTPRLAAAPNAQGRMGFTITIELLLVASVLAMTAVLTTFSSPHGMH